MRAQLIPSALHTAELVAVMDTPLAMKSPADHRGPLTVTTLLAHRTECRLAIVMSTTDRRLALMAETVMNGLARLALLAHRTTHRWTQLETTPAAIRRPLIRRPLIRANRGPDRQRLIRANRGLVRRRLIRVSRGRAQRETTRTLAAATRPAVAMDSPENVTILLWDVTIRRPLIRAVDIPATIRLLIRPPVDMESPEIATLIQPALTLVHRMCPLRTAIDPEEKSPRCLPQLTWRFRLWRFRL